MKRMIAVGTCFVFFLCLHVGIASANKTATSIAAPENARKGSEITIKVTVTHSANSAFHQTQWLKVMANKKEIARWDYSSSNLPEAATFTKEIKVRCTEDLEVVAEASCNIHGSAGPATVKIIARDQK